MPHLAVMRRGWQNEHLAAYILSKIAFVAHPSKIGDDIGTDFFCTFFETIKQDKKDYLVPKNSFAIQIKSSGTLIDVTKQIEYYMHLELPLFIGIIDQEKSLLTVYSGEYLPILVCQQGKPDSLFFTLHPDHNFDKDSYFEKVADKPYKLKCPFVTTLSADMTTESVNREGMLLSKIASRVQKNIAARLSEEYIFSIGSSGEKTLIMAGPGSFETFRENFQKRLAEVFYNLSWIQSQPDKKVDMIEYKFYENIYNEMQRLYPNLPSCLTNKVRLCEERTTI